MTVDNKEPMFEEEKCEGCDSLGVGFNDDGQFLCEDCLFEEFVEEEEEQEEQEEEDDGSELDEEDEEDEEEKEEDEDEDEDEEKEEDEEDEEKEEDEEDEEKEEDEEDDEEKDDSRSQTIPRSRFDEVYGQLKEQRAANQRLAERLSELEKEKSPDKNKEDDFNKQVKELRSEMFKAIDDGKSEEAATIMEKIDSLNDQRLEQRLTEGIEKTSKASTAEIEYNLLVERIEGDFPVFDESSEHYDEKLIQQVLDVQQEFEKAGNKPALALEKALHFHRDEVEASMEKAGLVETEQETKSSKKETQRSKKSKERNKKLQGKQPSKTDGKNKSDVTISDIVNMTDEDFDKLSEAQLRKLQGDFV